MDADTDAMLMGGADIVSWPGLTDAERRQMLETMFIRAASNGDIGCIQECLTTEAADWIDLRAADEHGTTALISAACFGHVHIIQILLDSGASIDQKDENGWTPLMWACANGHKEASLLLIEYGADRHAKSNRGRSIVDLSTKNGNNDIVRILDPELADKRERKAAVAAAKAARAARIKLAEERKDRGQDVLEIDLEMDDPDVLEFDDDASDVDELASSSTDDDDDSILQIGTTFVWDKCQPDQMFVFDESIVDHILDICVRRIRPARGPDFTPVGANIIFLCARYAHYWNSNDMLRDFLNRAVQKISTVTKSSPDDVHFYAYWLSNVMQLLVYMKRDTGLLLSTFDAQCQLSELVHDIYEQIVCSVERKLLSILNAAVLDYKKLEACVGVRYEPVFFGLGKRRSLLRLNQEYSPPRSPRASRTGRMSLVPQYELSPMSINSILGSTLNVLNQCKVHEQVIHQLFHQLMYFLNAQLFNKIITTKELCCRARAMQLQMNLGTIQDWIRDHSSSFPQASGIASFGYNGTLVQHLLPTMQLTQFLQFVSNSNDLGSFLELRSAMYLLSISQCHKAMENYRFEVGEPSFPPDAEAYLQTLIDELSSEKEAKRRRASTWTNDSGDAEGCSGEQKAQTVQINFPVNIAGMYDRFESDALNPLLNSDSVLPFNVPIFGRDDTLWASLPFIPAHAMEMVDDRSAIDTSGTDPSEQPQRNTLPQSTPNQTTFTSTQVTTVDLATAATDFLTPIGEAIIQGGNEALGRARAISTSLAPIGEAFRSSTRLHGFPST